MFLNFLVRDGVLKITSKRLLRTLMRFFACLMLYKKIKRFLLKTFSNDFKTVLDF